MMRNRVRYANVMSTIAVFVALGGTSYAVASLPPNSVGNKQLRSNAVTASKVRNGSIGRADLTPSARGSRGSRGPQGPAGPAGAAGPAGIGNIIVRTRDSLAARPGLGAGSYVTVASVALPAGRWLVTATTEVTNFPSATSADIVRCFIVVDGARRGLGKVQVAGNGAGATASGDLYLVEVVDQANPASVALSCGHDGEIPAGSDTRFDRTKVVAVPVASADVQEVTG